MEEQSERKASEAKLDKGSNTVTPERPGKKRVEESTGDELTEGSRPTERTQEDKEERVLVSSTKGVGDTMKKAKAVVRIRWVQAAGAANACGHGMVYLATSQKDLTVLDVGITYDPQGWLAKRTAGHSLDVYNELAPWNLLGWIQESSQRRDRQMNKLIAEVKKEVVSIIESMRFDTALGSRKDQLFAHLEWTLSECFPEHSLELFAVNCSDNTMGDTLQSYQLLKMERIANTAQVNTMLARYYAQYQSPEQLMYNGIADEDIARISFDGILDGAGNIDIEAFMDKNWPDQQEKQVPFSSHPECMTGLQTKPKDKSVHEIISQKKSPDKRNTSNPYKSLSSEETWSLVSDIIFSCTQQITSEGDLTPEVFDAMFTLRDVAIRGDILQPRTEARTKFHKSKSIKTSWFNMTLAAQKKDKWAFRFFFYSVFAMMMLDCSHLRRGKK